MLLHCISLENEDPRTVYETIRGELHAFDTALTNKDEWIILTKQDLTTDEGAVTAASKAFSETHERVFVLSSETGEGVKELSNALTQTLRPK